VFIAQQCFLKKSSYYLHHEVTQFLAKIGSRMPKNGIFLKKIIFLFGGFKKSSTFASL